MNRPIPGATPAVLLAILATTALPAQDRARTAHPADVEPTYWLELAPPRDAADVGTAALLVRGDGARTRRTEEPAAAPPAGWSPDRSREVVVVLDRARHQRDLVVRPVRAGRVVRASDPAPTEVRLTRDADDLDPFWGPDGASVCFRSDRGGDGWQLWRAPADGGAPERLTAGEATVHAASPSPDGRTILLIRATARPPERRQGMRTRDLDVSLLDPASGEVRTLVDGVFTADAAWSPDGTRIVAGVEDRVVVYDTASGAPLRSWQSGEVDPRARGHGARGFVWRPDGAAFACKLGFLGQVAMFAGEAPPKLFGDDEVFVLRLDGTATVLAPPEDPALRALWTGRPVGWRRLPG